MRTILVVAVFVALAPAATVGAEPTGPKSNPRQTSGQQWVMKIELATVPAAATGAPNNIFATLGDLFRQIILPDGVAEMTGTTDGKSSRLEVRGRWAFIPSGGVMLRRAEDAKTAYVLNPADKTYFVVKPDALKPPQPAQGAIVPKPEIHVKPSGVTETIAGHRTERKDISWRMPIPLREGVAPPPGMPEAITLDLEAWCGSDVKMPQDDSQSFALSELIPGGGLDDLLKDCAYPLRMRLRTSTMPGYEIVASVVSIVEASPPADLFTIPAGYTEVPMPKPKLPGGPGGGSNSAQPRRR